MSMQSIKIQPLSTESFLPFGEVIACQGNHYFHINEQQTERYHALAEVESDTKVGLSIFRNMQKLRQFLFKSRCWKGILYRITGFYSDARPSNF